MQAADSSAQQRWYVIKDDAQPSCAISHEAFTEEWDEDLQEWIYTDAVRLPAEVAQLPGIAVEPGSIVKTSLLDEQTLHRLQAHMKAQKGASNVQAAGGVKRERAASGAADGPLAQLAKLAGGFKQEPSSAAA